jgi:hypothetical protein
MIMNYAGSIANLNLATSPTQTSKLNIPAPADVYYFDFDYKNRHLAYVALGGIASYPLQYRNLATGTQDTIGSSTYYKEDIHTDGQWIAWVDYRNVSTRTPNNSEVYLTSIPAMVETRVTSDTIFQGSLTLAEGVLAWVEGGQVILKNLTSNIQSPASTSNAYQDNPSLGGGYAVWEDYRENASAADIWLKNLATGSVTTLCNASGHQGHPAVSNTWAVWEDYRAGGFGVLWGQRFSDGVEMALTSPGTHSEQPYLVGSQLYWYEMDSSSIRLLTRNLAIEPTSINKATVVYGFSLIPEGMLVSGNSPIQVEGFNARGAKVVLVQNAQPNGQTLVYPKESGYTLLRVKGPWGIRSISFHKAN